MTGTRPFTILRGFAHPRPPTSEFTEYPSCYITDDGGYVIILPGHRSEAIERLGETMGLGNPSVSVHDHYCTITAGSRRPAFGLADGNFHLFIALATVAEQQRSLADYNIAETASTFQHMPGFCSASFFLQQDQPVVHELVAWQSEKHSRRHGNGPSSHVICRTSPRWRGRAGIDWSHWHEPGCRGHPATRAPYSRRTRTVAPPSLVLALSTRTRSTRRTGGGAVELRA